jgi:two-component system sensor histidine kinase DesK
MLLPRRWVSVAIVMPSVVAMVWIADFVGRTEHGSPLRVVIWMLYYLVVTLLGGLALYWSTRLTRVLDQLGRARTELADLAVGRERLRVSRDLHDLLGHSLSAVSLKGDLALRLLPVDANRAREEIESLTQLARATLRDMRAVTRDQHAVSLRSEVDAAVAMLAAADVRTRVVLEVRALPPAVEVVLAWAVREAATNILRHSDATECSITASWHGGTVRLEIVNDGAIASSTGAPRDGHGLAGIDERARTLSGSATGSEQAGGVYRLLVDVPEGAR